MCVKGENVLTVFTRNMFPAKTKIPAVMILIQAVILLIQNQFNDFLTVINIEEKYRKLQLFFRNMLIISSDMLQRHK